MPRTDVRVRIRRGVVRITVEQTCIQPVVPIATYIQHLPTCVGVEIIFITKNKNFLTNEGSDWYRSQLARDSPGGIICLAFYGIKIGREPTKEYE